MKLRKGDEVKVIRGKDKGKTGKIEKVVGSKVIIPNVNLFKRHIKARSQNQKSEIVTLTKPLAMANVKMVCPKCHLPTRVGYVIEGSKKERICKKCKQVI